MSIVSCITSVSLSLVFFHALFAEPLSSQSDDHVTLMLEEGSVYVSGRDKVDIRFKDTKSNKALDPQDITHDETHISLKKLLAIGFAFSPEEFVNSVPKEFKCFYMLNDNSGKYQLTLGGFLVSGGDYSFLSPEQAAQEELARERADGPYPCMRFIRCTSPVHLLTTS